MYKVHTNKSESGKERRQSIMVLSSLKTIFQC